MLRVIKLSGFNPDIDSRGGQAISKISLNRLTYH